MPLGQGVTRTPLGRSSPGRTPANRPQSRSGRLPAIPAPRTGPYTAPLQAHPCTGRSMVRPSAEAVRFRASNGGPPRHSGTRRSSSKSLACLTPALAVSGCLISVVTWTDDRAARTQSCRNIVCPILAWVTLGSIAPSDHAGVEPASMSANTSASIKNLTIRQLCGPELPTSGYYDPLFDCVSARSTGHQVLASLHPR
jgi:hypothetical protein